MKRTPKRRRKTTNALYWTGKLNNQGYAPTFTWVLRNRIRANQGWRCAWCGTHKRDTAEQLHVHHRDKDKRNSDPANLVGLCCDCHILIAHGGYWSELKGEELKKARAQQKAKIEAWEEGAKERNALAAEREREWVARELLGEEVA